MNRYHQSQLIISPRNGGICGIHNEASDKLYISHLYMMYAYKHYMQYHSVCIDTHTSDY